MERRCVGAGHLCAEKTEPEEGKRRLREAQEAKLEDGNNGCYRRVLARDM